MSTSRSLARNQNVYMQIPLQVQIECWWMSSRTIPKGHWPAATLLACHEGLCSNWDERSDCVQDRLAGGGNRLAWNAIISPSVTGCGLFRSGSPRRSALNPLPLRDPAKEVSVLRQYSVQIQRTGKQALRCCRAGLHFWRLKGQIITLKNCKANERPWVEYPVILFVKTKPRPS